MTTMISEIYEAFIDAGVSPDKAKSAAEALSAKNLATKQDVNRIDQSTRKEMGDLKQELIKIDAKLDKELTIIKFTSKLTLAGVMTVILIPILKMLVGPIIGN